MVDFNLRYDQIDSLNVNFLFSMKLPNQIECTHETTAQKMGWRVISQPIPLLEKTNVSFQDTHNSNETVKKILETPR